MVDASSPWPELSVVNFRLQQVLDSTALAFRWDANLDSHEAMGILECALDGSPVFSLLTCEDTWISKDSSIQSFLDHLEHGSPSYSDSATTCLLLGLVMWWAHSYSTPGIDLSERISIPSRNRAVVAHWDEQYKRFLESDEIAFADLVLEVAHHWFELCGTYGFNSSHPDDSYLWQLFESEMVTTSDSPEIDFGDWDIDSPSPYFGIEVLDSSGQSVARSRNENEWNEFRRYGITATDARKLLKRNGAPSRQRVSLLRNKVLGWGSDYVSDAMAEGIRREPEIASWVMEKFDDVLPNDTLFQSKDRHYATPDMVGDRFVVEIKVSSEPIEVLAKRYSDQFQWQMYVMGLSQCLLVAEHRITGARSTAWVQREETRIGDLAAAADQFLDILDSIQGVPPDEFDFSALFLDATVTVEPELQPSPVTSTGFQPTIGSSANNVRFVEINDSPFEPIIQVAKADKSSRQQSTEDYMSDPSPAHSDGNPFKQLRELCNISQTEFRETYGFGKMTMVGLESGMYTRVSDRQEDAIRQACEERFIDFVRFLRELHHSESLNDAYLRWQVQSRKAGGSQMLAGFNAPFPFTSDNSPLGTLIIQSAGSLQHFCKTMKVPAITISRFITGETASFPETLKQALLDSDFDAVDQLISSELAWHDLHQIGRT